MTTTPKLTLSYIASSQAQKEVTHNDALNDLDFLAKTSVINTATNEPPATPSTGDSYIIGPAPTGAWAGFAGYLTGYYAGWSIKQPMAGWTAWTQNDNRVMYYTGSAWALLTTPKIDTSITWDPGIISHGSGATSPSITATGAALGDFCLVSAPFDLQGVEASAYVSAAHSVVVRLTNLTGAEVTLSSGAWRVRVVKY